MTQPQTKTDMINVADAVAFYRYLAKKHAWCVMAEEYLTKVTGIQLLPWTGYCCPTCERHAPSTKTHERFTLAPDQPTEIPIAPILSTIREQIRQAETPISSCDCCQDLQVDAELAEQLRELLAFVTRVETP